MPLTIETCDDYIRAMAICETLAGQSDGIEARKEIRRLAEAMHGWELSQDEDAVTARMPTERIKHRRETLTCKAFEPKSIARNFQ